MGARNNVGVSSNVELGVDIDIRVNFCVLDDIEVIGNINIGIVDGIGFDIGINITLGICSGPGVESCVSVNVDVGGNVGTNVGVIYVMGVSLNILPAYQLFRFWPCPGVTLNSENLKILI